MNRKAWLVLVLWFTIIGSDNSVTTVTDTGDGNYVATSGTDVAIITGD